MRSVEAFGGAAGLNNSTSSPVPNVKMEEDDDSEDSGSTNDEAAVANALHLAKENIISKAIDTMAKVFDFLSPSDWDPRPIIHLRT